MTWTHEKRSSKSKDLYELIQNQHIRCSGKVTIIFFWTIRVRLLNLNFNFHYSWNDLVCSWFIKAVHNSVWLAYGVLGLWGLISNQLQSFTNFNSNWDIISSQKKRIPTTNVNKILWLTEYIKVTEWNYCKQFIPSSQYYKLDVLLASTGTTQHEHSNRYKFNLYLAPTPLLGMLNHHGTTYYRVVSYFYFANLSLFSYSQNYL